ncbi:glycosyltransferase [Pannus brasiliensis CCIBt3594]|uniref:Glycosyltransferase n=1 Tax=Pannus brasiliensis CCIBt3594 TaxID=1427578 RepID=A0AAW9QRJ9_9CHRO
MLTISVLVPTYRRPRELERCLEALKRQSRPADEVIVVVRDSDRETAAFFAIFDPGSLPLQILTIDRAGQVASLNAGLEKARGEIIAITDDDAAPRPRWLESIEAHFLADERLGGVGGRDWVYTGDRLEVGTRALVGRVWWFGRAEGNHHLGAGEPREVDLLKGANMSYRRSAIGDIRFDERLKGTGAQVYNDMAFSFAVQRAGWKLVYDPAVEVDHKAADRFDEDKRGGYSDLATANLVHNETLVLLEYLPPLRRVVFLIWAISIGTRPAPGFLQALRLLPIEGTIAGRRLLASLRGRRQGWRTWRNSL